MKNKEVKEYTEHVVYDYILYLCRLIALEDRYQTKWSSGSLHNLIWWSYFSLSSLYSFLYQHCFELSVLVHQIDQSIPEEKITYLLYPELLKYSSLMVKYCVSNSSHCFQKSFKKNPCYTWSLWHEFVHDLYLLILETGQSSVEDLFLVVKLFCIHVPLQLVTFIKLGVWLVLCQLLV